MAYQETRTVGYGSRVGSSFKAIGGGFLLFFAATALLWWNEGRAVKTDDLLDEAEGKTEELATINRIDPEMDGHLVYATGMTTTEDSLIDSKFDVGVKAVKLKRSVEYYQEQEHAQEEHKDKFGGKEEITTTYTYSKDWSSKPVNSSEFHESARKNDNFVLTNVEQWDDKAKKVMFGAFELNDYQIGCIHDDEPVEIQIDSTRLVAMNKEAQQSMQLRVGGNCDSLKLVHVTDNQIYYGVSPSNPQVGDVRITWTKVMPKKVSIIANQKGNTFTSFKSKKGKTYQRLVNGTKTADEIFESDRSANHTLMWVLRFIGCMLVIGGLKMIFGFLETILKVVPFLANILGWGVGVVCTVVGVVWSLIIIALAWLFYRPVIGIILLAIAGFLVWVFAFRGKEKLKELANRGRTKAPETIPTNNG